MMYKQILQADPEEAEHSQHSNLLKRETLSPNAKKAILKINFKQSSFLCEDKVQMLTLAKSPQGFQLGILHRIKNL